MALKRSDIRAILENAETSNDDKAKAILDALHGETDELKDQLDAAKKAQSDAEKERDSANSGKQAAEKALSDYKTQQKAKETKATKALKARDILKKAGVLEKYLDDIINDSKKGDDFINGLELDASGEVVNADEQLKKAKTEFKGKIGTSETKGANVNTPPANNGGTSLEDFRKMSLDERMKFKATNPDLYDEYRRKK